MSTAALTDLIRHPLRKIQVIFSHSSAIQPLSGRLEWLKMDINVIVKPLSLTQGYTLNLQTLSAQHPADFSARKHVQNADVRTLSAPYDASQCENDCMTSKSNTHANNYCFQSLMNHRPRTGSEE